MYIATIYILFMLRSSTLFDSYKDSMPRERLFNYGADVLSDTELLALVLRSGGKNESVIALSSNLLRKYGGLKNLMDVDIHALTQYSNIGNAKAASIKASYELGKRIYISKSVIQTIKSPQDIYSLVRKEVYAKEKEHLYLLSFDSRMHLISLDLLSVGTVNETLIHPREVFKVALGKNAVSIALAHNHPSNDPTPSDPDIALTSKIFEACQKVGMILIDHIIACNECYFSLKEHGYIGRTKFYLKGGEKV